jgi:asparagine synthase (glutamine-hydrolysing)
VLNKYLPPQLIGKKKQGFVVPLENWFKGSLLEYVKTTLLEGNGIHAFFDRAGIEKIITDHVKGMTDHDDLLWALLVFENWYTRFLRSVK